MERFWNIIHYFVYRADCKAGWLLCKCLGIHYLYNLSFIKKRMIKKGIKDPVAYIKTSQTNHDNGTSIIMAGGAMYGLPNIMWLGIFFLYLKFSTVLNYKIMSIDTFKCSFFILCGLTSLITYFLLFHKNKYRKYFKEFDKKPHKWKVKWAWISLGVILFPFAFVALVVSFMV